MKVLIYTDTHISQYSSIVKSLGKKYSTRLEQLILSFNWAEKLAVDEGCQAVFNLGDTFDKPTINPMEATAVQEIQWNNLPHYVLVGNHDSNVQSLEYSSVAVLKKNGFNVLSEEYSFVDEETDTKFIFIPYVAEDIRQKLDYPRTTAKQVILSHNDIAGFNFGKFVSTEGFSVDEIEANCDLFLNGHLHNKGSLGKKIINVGNLCGQNFNEDSFRYQHGAFILDTATMELKFYENPYSLNFYKLLVDQNHPLSRYTFKDNAVLMIKCEKSCVEATKEYLDKIKPVAYRLNIYQDETVSSDDTEIKLEKVDHIQQFKDYILETLGNTEIVRDELAEVCK